MKIAIQVQQTNITYNNNDKHVDKNKYTYTETYKGANTCIYGLSINYKTSNKLKTKTKKLVTVVLSSIKGEYGDNIL